MSQAFAFITFAVLFCLANGEKINGTEVVSISVPDVPQYVLKQNVNARWYYTFSPNLRGFLIFDKYFKLEAGEELSVYNGEYTEPRFCLAKYTNDSTVANQRLTFGKGQGITVIFTTSDPTPAPVLTTTAESEVTTTIKPQFFMFLVSAYDEPASLQNSTQISGIIRRNVTDYSLTESIETNSNVTQYWHFYPVGSNIRLSFLLQSSSALNTTNNKATLTLYRGNADNLDDTSTIIKTYQNLSNFDTESHIFDFGETLSLYFNYPANITNDVKLGYLFIVSPTVNGTVTTTTAVTDASGNTVTKPTMPVTTTNTAVTTNVTGTGTVTVRTTTTSAAAPFVFSIAPIIISLIFQMRQ